VNIKTNHIVFFVFLFAGSLTGYGQTWSIHGQASTWLTLHAEAPPLVQTGLRYLPEVSLTQPMGDTFTADIDMVLNGVASATFGKQIPAYDATAHFYRAWIRVAAEKYELRAGLQKLNFGSATLFRPLMWFDKVDPRDPLQLTDGVYALLARYTFIDNANIWLWVLYGNEKAKGWETVPTESKSIEYGGRIQVPMGTGELGGTYHHREADFTQLSLPALFVTKAHTPEDRFALDGKWDIGMGAWFEAALTHDRAEIPGMIYQRQWTLGADYTFDIGNGLNALTEYFRSDNPDTPLASADGLQFSALSLNYPLGLLDRVSCIVYRDWKNQEWYRLVTWQRTFDNWLFYVLGFWNPKYIRLYDRTLTNTPGQSASNPFAGTGIQLMLVFNH
jgi:hypothetical protein